MTSGSCASSSRINDVSPLVWSPVAVSVLAALGIGCFHQRLPPKLAVRVLVTATVCAAGAVSVGLAIAIFAFVLHLPVFEGLGGWCDVLVAGHHRVPLVLGIASTVAFAVGYIRTIHW